MMEEDPICKDVFVADEAMEILGRYFSGISPDLPILIRDGQVISLYQTKVQLRRDGIYKIDVSSPILGVMPLIEKEPGCSDYVLYLNGELYNGENTDCF